MNLLNLIKGYDSSSVVVYIYLQENANDVGICECKIEEIAKGANLTNATVVKSIKKLEKEGLIIKEARPKKPTVYKLL